MYCMGKCGEQRICFTHHPKAVDMPPHIAPLPTYTISQKNKIITQVLWDQHGDGGVAAGWGDGRVRYLQPAV